MAVRPTPYSIAVSTFIALHCQDDSPLYENNERDRPLAEKFLQETLQTHETISPLSLHDRPLHALLEKMTKCVGLELSHDFLSWLQVSSVSIDSLEDLMLTCKCALSNMDPHCRCGLYLWSVTLGYDELSFESVSLLWKDYRDQVASVTLQGDGDGSGETEHHSQNASWPLSQPQLSDALHRTIVQEQGVVEYSATEGLTKLPDILESNPELPLAHFLHFYNSLLAGDREAAVDALHQYLDYSFDSGSVLQYAAIVAAVLHYSFGDIGMARAATDEAVRVAQQSQDPPSVAFALGWLGKVESTQSQDDGKTRLSLGPQQELIRRCIQHASECNLRSLVAGANMVLTQITLASNSRSNVWESLSSALTDDVVADGSSGLDRPTQMANVHSGDDALRTMSRQRLVAAGVWDAVGHEPLSELSTKAMLQGHRKPSTTVTSDVAVAIQNLARSSLLGFSTQFDLESNPVRCSSVQEQLETSRDLSSLASNECIYSHALKKLIGLRELYQLPFGSVFLEIGLLLHEWAVRRCELRYAETLALTLANHICPRLQNYDEVALDLESQNALRLSRESRWEEATSLLHRLIAQCKMERRSLQHAKLLLQLSIVSLDAAPGFTSALTPLLECLTLTESCNMNGIHAAALTVLGHVHLRMKKPKRAIAVIENALPTLLQHEHVWLQAEAYLTLAKCFFKEAQCSTSAKSIRYLHMAANELDRSAELFRRCEDCHRLREVYYLQARLFDSLNEPDDREKAASCFVVISRHVEQASRQPVFDLGIKLNAFDSKQMTQQISYSSPVVQ